ncbi:MAG: hypothetical protein NW216_00035 [Hyphomicrobium sp.]|nr:hypothetical protein [Hyphomicrobium sp.]
MAEFQEGDIERLKLQIELWKEAISSSKHFTEMAVRTRQLGLTFVVAAFALAITLLSQYPTARLPLFWGNWGYDIHLGGPIIAASAIGLFVTRHLDVKLYHRMLRGSVAFTMELEEKCLRSQIMLTSIGLAESISEYSRSDETRSKLGRETKITTAEQKIHRFYMWSICFIIVIGILLTCVTANGVERRTIINQQIEIN